MKASVEAIESRDPTTSGHSRRVAELTVTLAKVVDGEASGPYAARFVQAGGPARARVREPAARLREDRRTREGPRQGQEALRRAARARSRPLRLRRPVDRGRCARAQGAPAGDGGIARAASRRSIASSPSAARTSTARGRRSARANEPTVLSSGDFAADRGDRQGDVRRSAGRGAPAARRRRDHLPQGEPGLADAPGVRRDPVARLAHLPVSVADPVGQGAQPGPHHRRRAPREAERHRVPQSPPRRGDPGAIEDDEPSPTSTTR